MCKHADLMKRPQNQLLRLMIWRCIAGVFDISSLVRHERQTYIDGRASGDEGASRRRRDLLDVDDVREA